MEDVVENLGMVGSVVLKSRLASGPASPSHRPTHYDVSVDGDEHAAIRGARLDITSGQPEPHWWEALDACCQFASHLFFLFERRREREILTAYFSWMFWTPLSLVPSNVNKEFSRCKTEASVRRKLAARQTPIKL